MALKDNKIVAWSDPVVNQPDRPQIDADRLKSVFDSNSNELKEALNATIDALEATGGIDLIGVSSVEGVEGSTITEQLAFVKEATERNVSDVNEALTIKLEEVEADAEEKINKTESRLTEKINDVDQRLEASNIPTGGTAGQYLKKRSAADFDLAWDTPAGGGDMLRTVYDQDDDGKVDRAESADHAEQANDSDRLGGEPAQCYAKKAELTGTLVTGDKAAALNGVIDATALTKVELYGKSVQDGVPSPDVSIPTGKNMACTEIKRYSDCAYEILENGYKLTYNGASSGSGYGLMRLYLPESLLGKTVSFSATFDPDPGIGSSMALCFDAPGAYTHIAHISNAVQSAGRRVTTATIPSSIPEEGQTLCWSMQVANGTAVTGDTVTISDIMIVEGEYTADTMPAYEPYQGGPVEIESVVADSITVCGENLFPAGLVGTTLPDTSKTIFTSSFTISEGTYTAYINTQDTQSTAYGVLELRLEDASGTRIVSVLSHGDPRGSFNVTYTFTITAEQARQIAQIELYFNTTNGSAYIGDVIKEAQLTRSDIALEYEPYTGATYPITPEITMRGIPVDDNGNYMDENGQQWICDTYDVATGEYVQRCGLIVCDGATERWALPSSTADLRLFLYGENVKRPELNTEKGILLSSHYINLTSNDTYAKQTGINVGRDAGNKVAFAVYDDRYNDRDLSKWTAYLAAQYDAGTPVTVQYALAEPIITQLNPVYIPAYSPVTNVTADGDIRVEYNNIPKSMKRLPIFIKLTKNAWTGSVPYTQSIAVTGIQEDMRPIADIVLSETMETAISELEAWALVDKIETGSNRITATCYNAPPETDIKIVLKELV